MTPEELRIGNILYFPFISKNVEVLGINSYESNSGELEYKLSLKDPEGNLYCEPISVLQPIPLTEEWLLKFGFEKDDDSLIRLDLIEIFFSDNKPYVWIYPTTPKKMKHIEYVHQLQNLYFALTGEELNFKE